MEALLERIRTMREDLEALEQGLLAGPRPEALAWLELDAEGCVRAASPRALARLGASADAIVKTPLGALADVDGDPLSDGVFAIATRDGRASALSVGAEDGRVIVIGATGTDDGVEGAALSRKFVHDMSNVLGIMRGRAELVAMQHGDEGIRRAMAEIQKAADRALVMLDVEHPKR